MQHAHKSSEEPVTEQTRFSSLGGAEESTFITALRPDVVSYWVWPRLPSRTSWHGLLSSQGPTALPSPIFPLRDPCQPPVPVPGKALLYKVLVPQSCLTLCDLMDCSPPGSSVHGILQARMLEWVAIPFSRRSSPPRDQTQVSSIAGGFFIV